MLALAVVLGLFVTGSTETSATQAQPGAVDDVNGKRYDPRDLSGIYHRVGGDEGFGPASSMPPLTPAGEAKLRSALPVRSRHPLAKAAGNASSSNDLALTCNPKGIPRLVLDTQYGNHEVIMLPNRMLQLWQEERRPREIWLDGRAIPSKEALDELGPAWYGHAVGAWEGNTLLVTTVGLDDRTWLDSFGFPKGADARVEERYRLVDPNTLELTLTVHDPEMYTKPWVSDVKTWRKQPRQNVTRRGWFGVFGGLEQVLCAPTALKR
jgi:hypothetical protein